MYGIRVKNQSHDLSNKMQQSSVVRISSINIYKSVFLFYLSNVV